MPLWRPYLSYLKSGIADIANSGGSRMAGCITAALYLERFVPEGQAWTHVDVYSLERHRPPGQTRRRRGAGPARRRGRCSRPATRADNRHAAAR